MSEVTRYDLTEDVITGVIDITPVPQNMEGRYVAYEDYAELKAERDALAADLESAKRSLTENYLRVTKERNNALYKVIELNAQMPETPATDAYLNSVRAEGVEMCAEAVLCYAFPTMRPAYHNAVTGILAKLRADKDGE